MYSIWKLSLAVRRRSSSHKSGPLVVVTAQKIFLETERETNWGENTNGLLIMIMLGGKFGESLLNKYVFYFASCLSFSNHTKTQPQTHKCKTSDNRIPQWSRVSSTGNNFGTGPSGTRHNCVWVSLHSTDLCISPCKINSSFGILTVVSCFQTWCAAAAEAISAQCR